MSAILPALQGTDLSGNAVAFPRDLPLVPTVLIFGFQHDSRQDVNAWKRALDGAGVPWMSLPTPPENVPPQAVAGAAAAMKAHAPEGSWSRTVLINVGGPELLSTFGWTADLTAKVLLVLDDGTVLYTHGGPFTDQAAAALLEAI